MVLDGKWAMSTVILHIWRNRGNYCCRRHSPSCSYRRQITLTPNATGATRQSCRKTNAFNRLRHAIYELQTPMIPALFKSRLRSGNLEVENVCSIDNQRSPKYRTEREKQICLPVEQTTSLLWLLSNETGVNNETMFTES